VWLGAASTACSLLTLCLGAPGLVGVALGIAVWVAAAHDLEKMRRGVMDGGGYQQTRDARGRAVRAVLLGAVSLVCLAPTFAQLVRAFLVTGLVGD
jgi:hypothetical protein